MAPRVQSAAWCYTWNNPNVSPEEHHASFSAVDPVYHVFQRESGESGTVHFQGYLEFVHIKSLTQLKSCNPQIHWEKRQGTQQQAVAYCRKHCDACHKGQPCTQETKDYRLEGPWSYGEPKTQSRTGMSPDFIEQVRSGKRLRDLLATHASDIRKYPRFYHELRRVFPPPQRDTPANVVLLIGPPGCGKTRFVRDSVMVEDLFIKPVDRGFWMDGYDGQPVVLLDDFAGAANLVTLVNLLQLIDRYQTQVPVKGSFVWWQPNEIYITTNIHPANWYKWEDRMEQWPALQRRITSVREWTKNPNGGFQVTVDPPHFWDYANYASPYDRATQ